MTWNQVALLTRMSVCSFLCHKPPEATSSQKSVLFHDLCPRVCDPQLCIDTAHVFCATSQCLEYNQLHCNIALICKTFSKFTWHVLWQLYSTSHKMCMETVTRLVLYPTNRAKFIQCVYVCTVCIKKTWQFLKWNNFLRQGGKILLTLSSAFHVQENSSQSLLFKNNKWYVTTMSFDTLLQSQWKGCHNTL